MFLFFGRAAFLLLFSVLPFGFPTYSQTQTQGFQSPFTIQSYPQPFLPGWYANDLRATSSLVFRLATGGINGSVALAVQPISSFTGWTADRWRSTPSCTEKSPLPARRSSRWMSCFLRIFSTTEPCPGRRLSWPPGPMPTTAAGRPLAPHSSMIWAISRSSRVDFLSAWLIV